MRTCPKCNHETDDEKAEFCPRCGTQLPKEPKEPKEPKVIKKTNLPLIGASIILVSNIILVIGAYLASYNADLSAGGINSIIGGYGFIETAVLSLLISFVVFYWILKHEHFFYVVVGLFLMMMIIYFVCASVWLSNGWNILAFGMALLGTIIVAMSKEEFI